MSRLQTLIAEAEAMLPESERDMLADIVASFMAAQAADALVTPEELEELKRIDAEPDDLASPEEVAAFFGRRG